MSEIKVRYESIDHFRKTGRFRTLEGARKFAHKYVGKHPDVSWTFQYAVSDDGVGKITVEGATMDELFPEEEHQAKSFSEWQEEECDV